MLCGLNELVSIFRHNIRALQTILRHCLRKVHCEQRVHNGSTPQARFEPGSSDINLCEHCWRLKPLGHDGRMDFKDKFKGIPRISVFALSKKVALTVQVPGELVSTGLIVLERGQLSLKYLKQKVYSVKCLLFIKFPYFKGQFIKTEYKYCTVGIQIPKCPKSRFIGILME